MFVNHIFATGQELPPPGPYMYEYVVAGNGTVGAVLHKSNVGTANIFAGDGNLVNDGQWHHVAAVFNRAGNMIRCVDGIASGTPYSLAALSGQSLDNTNQLRIGARDQSGDEVYFKGRVDDARVDHAV